MGAGLKVNLEAIKAERNARQSNFEPVALSQLKIPPFNLFDTSVMINGLNYTSSMQCWSAPETRHTLGALHARLVHANILDLMQLSILHGVDTVGRYMEEIKDEIQPKQYEIQLRTLNAIGKGLTLKKPLKLQSSLPQDL